MLQLLRSASLSLALVLSLNNAALAFQTDPAPRDKARQEFLAQLERTIGEDAYFSRVDYAWSRKHVERGLAFVVQRPSKETPGYADELADRYAPWFTKLESIFVRDYAAPLELADNGNVPLFALAVVANEYAYKEHVDINEERGLAAARAYYSPEKRLALTYREMNSLGLIHEMRPALHEMVHALQHRYSSNLASLPESPFFNEGLADYLSYHTLENPEDLEKHALDYRALELCGALMLHPRASAYVLPVKSAVACKGYADVVEAIRQQCAQQQMPLDWEFALGVFYAQAHTYMHFLHQSEHAERARKFVGLVLRGVDPPLALEQAIAPLKTLELDEGFRRYVAAVIKKQRPHFDPKAIPLPSEASAPIVRSASSGGATPRMRADPAKAARALALKDEELDERLAAALARASRGAFDAALAELEQLSSSSKEPIAARARVERERLAKFSAALETSLSKLAPNKPRVELQLDGQRVKGALVAFGGGKLTLEIGGVKRELELAQVGLTQLADLVPKPDKESSPELLKFYPYMLAGDSKWKRLTAPGSSEFKALKQDAEEFYPAHAKLGAAVLAAADIAAAPKAENPEQARALLAAIEALWSANKQLAFISKRASALNEVAAGALERLAAELGARELTHGEVTELENGALKLAYRFKSEAESQDFVFDELLRDQVWEEHRKGGDPGTFAPAVGGFKGHGDSCWRHVLEFEAPLTVRYSVRSDLREGVELSLFGFALGACADRMGASLRALNQSALVAETPNERRVAPCRGGREAVNLGQLYRIELRHDGQHASMWIGGSQAALIENVGLRSGQVFLATLGELSLHVAELEIEGQLSAQALDGARRSWIDAQLSKLAIR